MDFKPISTLVVDKINQNIPINRLCNLQIPDGIVLADSEFHQPSEINLFLGAEIFLDLLCVGQIRLADSLAEDTFGMDWEVNGAGSSKQAYSLQSGSQ